MHVLTRYDVVHNDLFVISAAKQRLIVIIEGDTKDVAMMLRYHGARLDGLRPESLIDSPQQDASIVSSRSEKISAQTRELNRVNTSIMT